MPLYNNILSSRKNESEPAENNPPKSSATNASLKLLQDHLLSKRRAQQQCGQNSASKNKKHPDRSSGPKQTLHQPLQPNVWSVQDEDEEYDPMVPNSYEVAKAELIKAEKHRLANSIGPSNKKLNVPHLLDVLDKLDGDDRMDVSDQKNRGTAIAPPASLNTRHSIQQTTKVEGGEDVRPFVAVSTNESTARKTESASSIAARIMSKMGYKQGQGLGKNEQGISEPLEVEKSGANIGKILTMPAMSAPQAPTSGDDIKPTNLPTRVLLLQNMVGPGEVDEELESETKEECKKYGDVVKCLIYEIPNQRVPDDEAVRIFVEFLDASSAIRAFNDLNGRYFGGRVVRTTFYSVEKFNKYELAP